MAEQREFWAAHKEPIEYLTSQCVGFFVQLYWAAGDQYQIMLRDICEDAAPALHNQLLAKDFWEWHLRTNEQWFATPLKAAEAFVKAWFQYIDVVNLDNFHPLKTSTFPCSPSRYRH